MSAASAGDIDTCALASAGASLSPSPTISTRCPSARSASRWAALSAGLHRPRRSLTCSVAATRSTSTVRSPDRIASPRPRSRRRCKVPRASLRSASSNAKRTGLAPAARNHNSGPSTGPAMSTLQKARLPRRAPSGASRPAPACSTIPRAGTTAKLRAVASRTKARASGWRPAGGDGGSARELFGPDHAVPGHDRPSNRQGAGLVEYDRVDFGQPFQTGRAFDQHAAPQQRTRGDDLHRRHRQSQRAGAGHQQHRDRARQRVVQIQSRHRPDRERPEGQQMHHRRVDAADPVGERDDAAAPAIARSTPAARFRPAACRRRRASRAPPAGCARLMVPA